VRHSRLIQRRVAQRVELDGDRVAQARVAEAAASAADCCSAWRCCNVVQHEREAIAAQHRARGVVPRAHLLAVVPAQLRKPTACVSGAAGIAHRFDGAAESAQSRTERTSAQRCDGALSTNATLTVKPAATGSLSTCHNAPAACGAGGTSRADGAHQGARSWRMQHGTSAMHLIERTLACKHAPAARLWL
jgi:hypothetical protein